MSNGSYQGIALYGGPVGVNAKGERVSGMIMVPENIPHYYVELPGDPRGTKLQVVTVGVDSQGNKPPEPDPQFRAPTYHPATKAPSQSGGTSLGIELVSQGLALLKKG